MLKAVWTMTVVLLGSVGVDVGDYLSEKGLCASLKPTECCSS